MDPGSVQNRRDLARYLQAQMEAARLPWPPQPEGGDSELEAEGRTAVKTYLLEAHASDAPTNEPLKFFRDVGKRLGVRVKETRDPALLWLRVGDHDLWCDTSMGRFWRLHTAAPVKDADDIRTRLVAGSPWLDNVWLPPSMLEALPRETASQMQTFSLNHDRRPLTSADAAGGDLDYVSMRLWASRASDTLAKLRAANVFPHGVSIRSVRIRSEAEEGNGEFCVSEYYHHGKVTVTGNSFDVHNSLLVHVVRSYRDLVEGIERRYGLGYAEGDPALLLGDPVALEMEWTVRDFEYAVGKMFASVEPFRLWGLPEQLTPYWYRARAVDLHVGQTLTFDVTPDHVLIQLPRGTCGNTIVRFVASLQAHLNSDAGKALLN